MNKIKISSMILVGALMNPVALAHEPAGSDYPTATKADYVFGCMQTNGQSMIVLNQCSCSIDYIAQRMSYEDYVRVETIMRTNLDAGQRGSMFRELSWAKTALDRFKKLQSKSNIECFR